MHAKENTTYNLKKTALAPASVYNSGVRHTTVKKNNRYIYIL